MTVIIWQHSVPHWCIIWSMVVVLYACSVMLLKVKAYHHWHILDLALAPVHQRCLHSCNLPDKARPVSVYGLVNPRISKDETDSTAYLENCPTFGMSHKGMSTVVEGARRQREYLWQCACEDIWQRQHLLRFTCKKSVGDDVHQRGAAHWPLSGKKLWNARTMSLWNFSRLDSALKIQLVCCDLIPVGFENCQLHELWTYLPYKAMHIALSCVRIATNLAGSRTHISLISRHWK